mmetsp:Transcript_93596/g.165622  ORF Transcript_93596/g.165622 Transcript_93596/m.165622 type:complete len:161 (-) Transcript_93596:28-510(-)
MRTLLLVSACLACAVHGRKVEVTPEQQSSIQLDEASARLATLLRAFSPAGGQGFDAGRGRASGKHPVSQSAIPGHGQSVGNLLASLPLIPGAPDVLRGRVPSILAQLTEDNEPDEYFKSDFESMSDADKLKDPLIQGIIVLIVLPFILGLIALFYYQGQM